MGAVTYQSAYEAVRARLGSGAASHSVRVAETAGDLAKAYGVDVESAKIAGILHDWDRELSHDELVAAASAHGMELTAADEAVPYLLHARTGARDVAAALPGLPNEIVSAVERHTLGAADMSNLDMVVYLADMMEPARDYKGVDRLRSAVGAVPLEELFAMGYQRSVMHLVKSRRRIHPETVVIWNRLVAGRKR